MAKRYLLTLMAMLMTAALYGCASGAGSAPEDAGSTSGVGQEQPDEKESKDRQDTDSPVEDEGSTVSGDESELQEQMEQFDRNLVSTEETFLNSARYITKFGESPRVLNYAINVYKPYRRTGKERSVDNHAAIKAKCDGDVYKKLRFLRADKNGSTIDISVYTDPESLLIDRIVTEEFCADGREMTDYYFAEGKLCYVYRYMKDRFATDYDDESLPGKKCCFEGEMMTGCVIDDQDVNFKKVAYEAADYKDLDSFTKSQYDELEKEFIKRAYLTYEAVRSVPGFATISGYVGDEFGGYLSNVHMTITSKANEYEWEFTTNGDGYFETRVPINTADYYGVTCEYGDYTVSTVDDINIVPGTVEYSLGVIYMAEPGNAVHEANTYLLNANYSSPTGVSEGEYCVVFDYEDKSVDLKCFSMDLKSKKSDSSPITVIKPGADGQYKYYVTDQRGGRSGNPMTYEMSTSRAQVKVYNKDGLVASYQVPAGVAGTVWEVFEIRDGKIWPINNYLIEATADPFFK